MNCGLMALNEVETRLKDKLKIGTQQEAELTEVTEIKNALGQFTQLSEEELANQLKQYKVAMPHDNQIDPQLFGCLLVYFAKVTGKILKDEQIASILIGLKEEKILEKIQTGQGKTLIIQFSAIYHILHARSKGQKPPPVTVLTHQDFLEKVAVDEIKELSDSLDISVAYASNQKDSDRYKADILYADVSTFSSMVGQSMLFADNPEYGVTEKGFIKRIKETQNFGVMFLDETDIYFDKDADTIMKFSAELFARLNKDFYKDLNKFVEKKYEKNKSIKDNFMALLEVQEFKQLITKYKDSLNEEQLRSFLFGCLNAHYLYLKGEGQDYTIVTLFYDNKDNIAWNSLIVLESVDQCHRFYYYLKSCLPQDILQQLFVYHDVKSSDVPDWHPARKAVINNQDNLLKCMANQEFMLGEAKDEPVKGNSTPKFAIVTAAAARGLNFSQEVKSVVVATFKHQEYLEQAGGRTGRQEAFGVQEEIYTRDECGLAIDTGNKGIKSLSVLEIQEKIVEARIAAEEQSIAAYQASRYKNFLISYLHQLYSLQHLEKKKYKNKTKLNYVLKKSGKLIKKQGKRKGLMTLKKIG